MLFSEKFTETGCKLGINNLKFPPKKLMWVFMGYHGSWITAINFHSCSHEIALLILIDSIECLFGEAYKSRFY